MKGKSSSDDIPMPVIPTDRIKNEPVEIREEFNAPTNRDRPQPPLKKKPVLTKEQRRKRRKRRLQITFLSAILAVGIVIGFIIGRMWPDRTEITFYANIKEVNEANLLVEGIDENDQKHRSEMYISLDKLDTAGQFQTAAGDDRDIDELSVGDLIRVTYDGKMQETFPLQLPIVWKIEQTAP